MISLLTSLQLSARFTVCPGYELILSLSTSGTARRCLFYCFIQALLPLQRLNQSLYLKL